MNFLLVLSLSMITNCGLWLIIVFSSLKEFGSNVSFLYDENIKDVLDNIDLPN